MIQQLNAELRDKGCINFKAFLEAPENADVRRALYDPEGHLFTLAANDQWTRYGTGNNYPSSAYATADESATLTQNSTTYTDYVNVMVPKFITGTEELTPATFQKFVDRLMSLGVEENLQLRQEIYDRHIGK